MAFDPGLAQRVRELLEELPGYEEKKMFGGICFLIHGNMAGGIIKDELIVRVGPAAYAAALMRPETHPFDLTGKVMTGWVMVTAAGYDSDAELADWMGQGAAYARALPAKGR